MIFLFLEIPRKKERRTSQLAIWESEGVLINPFDDPAPADISQSLEQLEPSLRLLVDDLQKLSEDDYGRGDRVYKLLMALFSLVYERKVKIYFSCSSIVIFVFRMNSKKSKLRSWLNVFAVCFVRFSLEKFFRTKSKAKGILLLTIKIFRNVSKMSTLAIWKKRYNRQFLLFFEIYV